MNAEAYSGIAGKSERLSLSRRRRDARRIASAGCLLVALLVCGPVGLLAVSLAGGQVGFSMARNAFKIGCDNVVLSNYQFQNGRTCFAT